MSITSGFYNSINGDRKYTAEQFTSLFDGIIKDGIFMSIGQAFRVLASSGMKIKIGTGRAWFDHSWILNDSEYLMDIPQSEIATNRIDAVVIETNNTQEVRNGTVKFIKGTPTPYTPSKPGLLRGGDINQYPLVYITVMAGSTQISQGDIENMIGTSQTPYVTGILSTVDASMLLAQWNSQFFTWFDTIKNILNDTTGAMLAEKIAELEKENEELRSKNSDLTVKVNKLYEHAILDSYIVL